MVRPESNLPFNFFGDSNFFPDPIEICLNCAMFIHVNEGQVRSFLKRKTGVSECTNLLKIFLYFKQKKFLPEILGFLYFAKRIINKEVTKNFTNELSKENDTHEIDTKICSPNTQV